MANSIEEQIEGYYKEKLKDLGIRFYAKNDSTHNNDGTILLQNIAGIQKYKEDIIQLPVKPGTDEVNYTEDDIDWDYMESYIRVMEKQVIADVVDYKESTIATAKELVYVGLQRTS